MEKKIKVQPEIIEQPIDVSEEPFVSVETQDKTVELDMTNGDQQILPDDGYALSSVTVDKPDTLAPENIKSGVNIGGVEGTYDPVLRVQLLFYKPFDGDIMITCTRTPAEIIEAVNNGITVVAYTAGHFLYGYSPLSAACTFAQVSVTGNTVAFEGVFGLHVNMWNEYPEAYVRIYKNVNSDGNLWSQTVDLMNGPEMLSISYEELVELRNSNQLIPGRQYRIDYQTIINGTYDLSEVGGEGCLHYARALNHEDQNGFDVVVTADDESHLNENARAVRNSWTSETSTPEAWELKYCLDNDTDRFAWASENGSGVIYYLKDEYGNEAGYDFKNIQFLRYALKLADATAEYEPADTGLVYNAETQPNRYGTPYHLFRALEQYVSSGEYISPFGLNNEGITAHNYDFSVGASILESLQWDNADDDEFLSTFNADWYFTFDYYDGNGHLDASSTKIDGIGITCRNNTILPDRDALATQFDSAATVFGLGANVFENCIVYPYEEVMCVNNYITLHSPFNTFGANCYSNEFGNLCYANIVGSGCYNNVFGNSTSQVTFGSGCNDNQLGNGCDTVTFGKQCHYNSLDDGCYYNTLGNNCHSNTMSNGCSGNTFRDYCNCNALGMSCTENVFRGYSAYNRLQGSDSQLVIGSICLDVAVRCRAVNVLNANLPPAGHSELISYNLQDGQATIIHKNGYNSETVLSTTDGGATWA